MNCPHCGFFVQDVYAIQCPRCGHNLTSSPGGLGTGTDAFSESPTVFSAQPPSAGPAPTDVSAPGGNYYAPYPNQGPPGSAPMYGPGSAPMYGQNMFPPSPPTHPPDVMAPLPPTSTPPRKGRGGLIIGVLIALVVLLASGLGVSLYALNARNQQTGQTRTSSPSTATTATASPTPTSTGTGAVLYQDAFTSGATGWSNDSHCFFEKNSYHVRDGYLCYAPAGNIGDGNFSVDAYQVSGDPVWFYGIVVRRVSKGNYYAFYVDGNSQFLFSKYVNGTRTDILAITPSAAIKGGLNTINTLLVRAQGSHFTFYVNGTKVGEADDSTFTTGYSGIEGGGGGIEVAFNNFKITALS